jgi:indole-3-glycerol phosphate synthase
MTDLLSRIIARKKESVARARARQPEAELRERAAARGAARPLRVRLEHALPGEANIIAEIKRASPSKGPIRPDLDPGQLAQCYAAGGAAALSVLTDRPFFQGSLEDLRRAREATRLPVLRKEFIISGYQLYESAAAGADAVLLIVRILSAAQLGDLLALSRELGLDALVEVHSDNDLALATAAGARLVGINNRNLQSFETDIRHALDLAGRLAPGQVAVAASGIGRREDVVLNLEGGIHNFLVGESLVRAHDPARALRRLRGKEPEDAA